MATVIENIPGFHTKRVAGAVGLSSLQEGMLMLEELKSAGPVMELVSSNLIQLSF